MARIKKKFKSGDIFSQKKRSEIMSGIKAKNTRFEKAILDELKNRGLRFVTHYSKVVGNPDIAVPAKKKAVFLDSDFWHGWRYPRWSFSGKREFWDKKILSNRKRDTFVKKKLRSLGWEFLRVWQHQLVKNRVQTLEKIEVFLKEETRARKVGHTKN